MLDEDINEEGTGRMGVLKGAGAKGLCVLVKSTDSGALQPGLECFYHHATSGSH